MEIVEIAKTEEVSLILIGSRGRGMITEVLLGSTTFDVIRLSDVPVLVEKYRKSDTNQYLNVCINKFEKILLPIDFSECSKMILERVKAMTKVVREVILLSVVEQGESGEELEEAQQRISIQLNLLVKELKDCGIEARGIVGVGTPSKSIVKLADLEEVTSIIMGTRGRGLIKSLLLGSTSDAVARTSKRPVILMPCSK